jgi:hypothetical protein
MSSTIEQRRKKELIDFYKEHDPTKINPEEHVDALFKRHTFEQVARAVLSKFGSLPLNWEDELPNSNTNTNTKRNSTLGTSMVLDQQQQPPKRDSILGNLGDLLVGQTEQFHPSASFKSFTDRSNPYATFLKAKRKYVGETPSELSLIENELVELIEADDIGWAWVRNKDNKEGYVPHSELIAVTIATTTTNNGNTTTTHLPADYVVSPPPGFNKKNLPPPPPGYAPLSKPIQQPLKKQDSTDSTNSLSTRRNSGRRSSVKTTEEILRQADKDRSVNAKLGMTVLNQSMSSVAQQQRSSNAKLGTSLLKGGLSSVETTGKSNNSETTNPGKEEDEHDVEELTIAQLEAKRRNSIIVTDSPRTSGSNKRRSTIASMIPSFMRPRTTSSGSSPRDSKSKDRVFEIPDDDGEFEFENPLLVKGS